MVHLATLSGNCEMLEYIVNLVGYNPQHCTHAYSPLFIALQNENVNFTQAYIQILG
jgi:hypothetical protein